MICRVRVPLALAIAAAVPLAAVPRPASAAELPQVELSASNHVPVCATPGRLMAFLESRNPKLDERFSTIAADYMRIGEKLHIRWDIAFFQMMLETGNLKFGGDVSADQNNFAGLGAVGKNVPGESFPNVATGVKAHLQHLLLYAGEHFDDPVAERTRKVQEWGVLTAWQKKIKGPINYEQLAKHWAPTSHHYASNIARLAEAFYGAPCKGPDPNPEMLALAKPGATSSKTAQLEASDGEASDTKSDAFNVPPTTLSGAELARRAVEQARKSGSFVRSSLGASSLIPEESAPEVSVAEPQASEDTPPASVKIINAALEEETPANASGGSIDTDKSGSSAAAKDPKAKAEKEVKTAALGAGTKSAVSMGISSKTLMKPPAGPKPSCKVWTASYGGNHSVIIRARADNQDNYTVLDVNEDSAKREAAAYIAAYAKGGKTLGEFANSSQALDKAFELCPDG
jgi:hypothetical protein